MENKIINWHKEIINMFPEVTERKLKPNHRWCEKCKGLGLYKEGEYITFCNECYGIEQIELCSNECGNDKKRGYIFCEKCLNEKETIKSKEKFDLAKKIKFADYNGLFILNDRVITKEEFEEHIFDEIIDETEPNTYIYATKSYSVLSIDIQDIIENECYDNGYEDMFEHLNLDGLSEIQESIDKWIEKQGNANLCYEETNEIVLLDDLIEDIKNKINKKG